MLIQGLGGSGSAQGRMLVIGQRGRAGGDPRCDRRLVHRRDAGYCPSFAFLLTPQCRRLPGWDGQATPPATVGGGLREDEGK